MGKLGFENGTAFGIHKAHSLAQASLLAYGRADVVERQSTDTWGFKDFQFFDAGDTQGFAMADAERVVVAFRGTEPTLEDWLSDLDLDLAPGPFGGQVHHGFSKALDAVWAEVDETISRFAENNDKSIWITGHSLGAALAALATARRLEVKQRVDGLYTFGQPRTGDTGFTEAFNSDFKSQTYRFVNNNDVVTRVPSRSHHYSHVGTLKYLTADGELVDDISYWTRFLDRVHGRFEDLFEWGSDGLKDHSMSLYENLLKRLVEAGEKAE